MADLPTFVALGALRCFARGEMPDAWACGRRAGWVRYAGRATTQEFYCHLHFTEGDVPIAGLQLVRRVNITAQIIFCGTSFQAPLAQAEAIRQLEAAVERAGGVINLHAVTSQIGRWAVPQGSTPRAGERGKGPGGGVSH